MRSCIFMKPKQAELPSARMTNSGNIQSLPTLITTLYPEYLNLFFLCAFQHTSSMHWLFAHRNWFGGHSVVSPLGQSTSILSSEPSLQSSSPSQVHDKGIQRPVVLQRKSVFGHTRVSENRGIWPIIYGIFNIQNIKIYKHLSRRLYLHFSTSLPVLKKAWMKEYNIMPYMWWINIACYGESHYYVWAQANDFIISSSRQNFCGTMILLPSSSSWFSDWMVISFLSGNWVTIIQAELMMRHVDQMC
jgi:hypothetical protein